MLSLFTIHANITLSSSMKLYHLRTVSKHYSSIFNILRSNNNTSLYYITAFENVNNKYLPYTIVVGMIINWLSRRRIYISSSVEEEIPTVSFYYPSALSAEREVYDLLGILFKNSPDLRRILTDYGFKQHPLRKIVPSIGWIDITYSASTSAIITRPIKMVTEKNNLINFNASYTQHYDG